MLVHGSCQFPLQINDFRFRRGSGWFTPLFRLRMVVRVLAVRLRGALAWPRCPAGCSRADRTIKLLEEFGAVYFELSQLAAFTAALDKARTALSRIALQIGLG